MSLPNVTNPRAPCTCRSAFRATRAGVRLLRLAQCWRLATGAEAKTPSRSCGRFLSRSEVSGHLIIAGSSSHTRSGFQERLAKLYGSERVSFPGYVPEPQVPQLFHSSALVVLPYIENTGASAVLHQTCQYGRVPLMRRLPVFEEMVDEMGLSAYFYDTEKELAARMCGLLRDPDQLAADGLHNFEAIRTLSMDRIGPMYWRLFDERG